MNTVWVCLNNFQKHLWINLDHHLALGEKNIFVITQNRLAPHFSKYRSKINLVLTEELDNTFNFEERTRLNRHYRGGFWVMTSSRFFYIYEFMKKYAIDDVLHCENDNLNYYLSEGLKNLFDKKKLYIPFDCYERSVPSIVYIPHADLLGGLLSAYDLQKNDMRNFPQLRVQHPDLITGFPVFVDHKGQRGQSPEQTFVTQNFDDFQYIFDPGAIGQLLSGLDPYLLKNPYTRTLLLLKQFFYPRIFWNNFKKILTGETGGYINELSVIPYHRYPIRFKKSEGIEKPFLHYRRDIPIFNLHIHSKKLEDFAIN